MGMAPPAPTTPAVDVRVWDPYALPASPHADDEEFAEGSTLADTGFSQYNPNSEIAWSIEPDGRGLVADMSDPLASTQHTCVYKAMPAEDEVEMCVAMWSGTRNIVASAIVNIGLGVYVDPALASDDLFHFGELLSGGERGTLFVRNEPSWVSTGAAAQASVLYFTQGQPIWLWMQVKKSTKQIELYYSLDGRSPMRMFVGPFTCLATGALANWGIHIMNRNNNNDAVAYFRNWRVTRTGGSGILSTVPAAAGGFTGG